MELSLRLEALLRAVGQTETAADIGTDHGFLAIELIRRQIAGHVIASDVRKGPLGRAEQHIREAGLEDRIELRLADGMAGLKPGEADTVVIAGMGGDVMASILYHAGRDLMEGISCLVLQPQSEFSKVRRAGEELGFCPVREEMVEDRGKYYWLMVMVPAENLPADPYDKAWQYSYGKILPAEGDPVLKEYLLKKREVLSSILEELKTKNTAASRQRCTDIETELTEIREALAYGSQEGQQEQGTKG